MAELDEFTAPLTGSFNDKKQYNSLQKVERNFPYAGYVSTACNDKISNLPLDFPGKFMVEESIYEASGKRHVSSHLFLSTEEPEGVLLAFHEIPESNNKAGSSYRDMTTTDFLCLKLPERFTPVLLREKSGAQEGGSISIFTPAMKSQLLECFLEDCLEVSEAIEVDGKRTFGYDQPVLYERVPE